MNRTIFLFLLVSVFFGVGYGAHKLFPAQTASTIYHLRNLVSDLIAPSEFLFPEKMVGEEADILLTAGSLSNSVPVVRSALAQGADPGLLLENDESLVFAVSAMGHIEVLEILLKAGADPNIPTKNENYPIFVAAFSGRADITELLLSYGADPLIELSGRETIRDLILQGTNVEDFAVVKLFDALRGVEFEIEWKLRQLITQAAVANDVAAIVEHEQIINSYDFVDSNGWTPMLHAASANSVDFVQYLISKGANASYEAPSGETPLIAATINGHTEVAVLLMESGISPLVENSAKNWSAIDYAYASGTAEKFSMVNVKIDVDPAEWGSNQIPLSEIVEQRAQRFFYGASPAAVAALNGDLELLKKNEKYLNEQVDGRPIIFYAAMNGQDHIVEFLAQKTPKDQITFRDESGMTPLIAAAIRGHTSTVIKLLQAGASVDSTYNRIHLLDIVRENRHAELANFIAFRVGPDVKRIQRNLFTLGLYSGPLDGVWDARTRVAVTKFKEEYPEHFRVNVFSALRTDTFNATMTGFRICNKTDEDLIYTTVGFEGKESNDSFSSGVHLIYENSCTTIRKEPVNKFENVYVTANNHDFSKRWGGTRSQLCAREESGLWDFRTRDCDRYGLIERHAGIVPVSGRRSIVLNID